MKVNKLSVFCNPYCGIHRSQGETDYVTWAGKLQIEPTDAAGTHGQIVRYVGCTALPYDKDAQATPEQPVTRLVSAETSLTVKGQTAVTGYAQHDVAFKYSTEPTVVPNTDYYKQAVFANDLTGHSMLVAADEATARACGINSAQFKDPLSLLEELRTEAINRFAASNSDITVEELDKLLPHVFPAPKAAAKKTAAPSQATTGGQS
jgi:hypothetical protein